MTLTIPETMGALLHGSWRLETLPSGRLCLTNAPHGQRFCCACGTWRPLKQFQSFNADCHSCHNRRRRAKGKA